ncbi:MAG TPA: hypothetical protein DET40_07975 [Lentisphaeria bacterium]|nr:MAG: hypothetical protein A2X45_11945 [Lentisphaerae bacterium GWF2_50_93]HCE43472.1 hypothetical protein [Lentisphaeria bacterium]
MVDKKVIIGSTSDSVVKPGDVTRISPAVGGDVSEDSVETSNIARIKTGAEEDKGKKTIRLKPVTAAEGSEAGAPPPQEDETVKIQKPRPVATPTVPGVKQTIKLRPSSNTPAPDTEATVSFAPPPQQQAAAPEAAPTEGAPAAKRTIRLVPKRADATAGGNEANAASVRPSAPTVKLEEPAQAGAPAGRSAVTVRLPAEGGGEPAGAPPKRTLKLKPVKPAGEQAPAPAPAPSPAGATDSEMAAISAADNTIPPMAMSQQESYASAGAATSDEPSMIHAILAFAALFVMIYFTWSVVGQYCNSQLDSKITVPGLSEKVK